MAIVGDMMCPTYGWMFVQAGTLSGNPLAMTAGLKTLEILDRPGAYEHLEKVTGRLIEGILQAGRDAGHAVTGGHISGQCADIICGFLGFAQCCNETCRRAGSLAVLKRIHMRCESETLHTVCMP